MASEDKVTESLAPPPAVGRSAALRDLALLYLRLGLTAFGGPAAHIAMMEDEVVRRRHWLTQEEFLDRLGAANLIPGPSSTEVAIYIGYQRAGFAGLLVAGVCFILPAAIMVAILAWAYVRYGHLPQVAGILYGVKPVVIAIIIQALWRLGRTALKTPFLIAVCLAATAAGFLGANELLMLVGAGAAVVVVRSAMRAKASGGGGGGPGGVPIFLAGAAPAVPATQAAAAALGATVAPGLWAIFLVFLKIGAVVFGSGYVLLAFLRADLVEQRHWMTQAQLLDAVAVGQVTPGPVFTTVTFIGYLLGGKMGALLATVGVFLPGFILVAISGPLVPRLRKSWIAAAALDGINAGSLALMVVVTWQLGQAAVVDRTSIVLAVVSAVLLLRFQLNSTWLVLGGALIGLAAKWA